MFFRGFVDELCKLAGEVPVGDKVVYVPDESGVRGHRKLTKGDIARLRLPGRRLTKGDVARFRVRSRRNYDLAKTLGEV